MALVSSTDLSSASGSGTLCRVLTSPKSGSGSHAACWPLSELRKWPPLESSWTRHLTLSEVMLTAVSEVKKWPSCRVLTSLQRQEAAPYAEYWCLSKAKKWLSCRVLASLPGQEVDPPMLSTDLAPKSEPGTTRQYWPLSKVGKGSPCQILTSLQSQEMAPHAEY